MDVPDSYSVTSLRSEYWNGRPRCFCVLQSAWAGTFETCQPVIGHKHSRERTDHSPYPREPLQALLRTRRPPRSRHTLCIEDARRPLRTNTPT